MTANTERAIVRERRIKLFFFLACLAALFVLLTQVNNLFISFLLSFVTYYMLSPAVNFLESRGLSRAWATGIPFIILTIFFVLGAHLFFPMLAEQFKNLQNQFPRYLEASTRLLQQLETSVSSFVDQIYPIDIKGKIQPHIVSWTAGFFQNLPDFLSQSLTILLLTPFFAFFMLLEGRDFLRNFISLVPNNIFELALNMQYQVGAQLGGFIRARLMQCILVGLILWIGLSFMGFPYALVLAVFAGLMNVIPYLGPFIGALPALAVHFANSGSSSDLFWLLIVYVGAQVIDTVFITPFIVARIVNLHPVTVILVVIIGAQTFGILGMIICIPVYSTLKVALSSVYKHLTDFRA